MASQYSIGRVRASSRARCRSNDDPILIAVIGVTGAGKSTFINRAAGRNILQVGHTFDSCTQSVNCVRTEIDGREVFLIDTPGFDDSQRTDAEVLEEISDWLTTTFWEGIYLNGIILLQPVEGCRGLGSERRRTRLFQKICGPDAYSHVVIGTTMWGKIRNRVDGENMVRQRRDSEEFWAALIRRGAEVVEHEDTRESALNIIRKVMFKNKTILQLQQELAECDGILHRTAAGRQLDQDLGQSSERRRRELDAIISERDAFRKSTQELEERIMELISLIESIEDQRTKLQNTEVRASSSKPQWIQAFAALGTLGVGAATAAIPLATGGSCTIL
ncbi:uncharacterized protein PV09_07355 [Verruconis gallopava]|uniref:G domain-containing protein n=1 Tax=Verruconis gallopava TaxID=253628 RepID=A0A0D2AQ88_9PEZI|nr:uncharacterized protein PV09_07355 [Verruconis gallopava]KIW01319.1 hypothetical protein PV09_07355 [Verruconis gallopava]